MVNKLQEAIKLINEYVEDSKPSGKFSKYFTLEELVRSETATRQGINNKPSKAQEVQLRDICKHILDPIREHFGVPIRVTSGYRCPKLNEAIGGSTKSQHMAKNGDCAVDFKFLGNSVDLQECFNWITKDSNLNFDQCISEFLPNGWIHISYVSAGKPNRKKVTVATKVKGKTVYKHEENK
tara:strand:+ start:1291 stop:1833 length:543 start_codon:yes stop_codon:yes gene_type:complete